MQGLVLARAHVEDRVLDQLLGRHLQTPTFYTNRGKYFDCKTCCPTGLWLMYHVRFAGGSVASELQFSCRLSPTEYLDTNSSAVTSSPVLGDTLLLHSGLTSYLLLLWPVMAGPLCGVTTTSRSPYLLSVANIGPSSLTSHRYLTSSNIQEHVQTTGNKRFIQMLKLRNTIGVSVSGHVAPARAGLGEPREEHLVLVAGPRLLQQSRVMSRCHVTCHVTMSCHVLCHVSCPVSCHVTYIQSDALYPVDGDWIWSAWEIAAMGGCDAP